MPVKTEAIGKEYPPVTYEVGAEKIREYADAVGQGEAVHRDREAAQAAGFRDVVAPPMFAVVYSARALGPGILDPEVGINFATMVHGGQEFVWGEPVCAGDTITTTMTSGGFPSEESWEILDGGGALICSDGPTPDNTPMRSCGSGNCP